MVERPIKKSERLAKAESGESSETLQPSEERNTRPPRNKDRGKGKGKGKRGERDEPKQAVNPALLRGPKPVKPKPPVEETAAETEDMAAEATSEEATETAGAE